ncbi:MAG TPA: hypothetical protein VFB90_07680 [Dehalococcoidia bacterium]|nr:hypothetical protein [Dehalococcoidia bacterium]
MIIGAVALLALVGALGAVVVSAQSGVSGTSPSDTLISKVAQKLGISEDKLKSAFKDSEKEMVDDSVNNGKLTPSQGDKIKSRIDAAPGLGLGVPHFMFGRLLEAGRHEIFNAAAQALNMDNQTLLDQLQSGKTLAQVAQDKGISADKFKTDLLANIKSDLDAKVSSQDITQTQADRLYQDVQNNIDKIINATPKMHRGPGGPNGQTQTSFFLNG